MRHRRPADVPFSIGTRGLLGMIALVALLASWGAWAALIATFAATAYYVVLSAAAVYLASTGLGSQARGFNRWRRFAADDGSMLRIFASVYLIVHYVRQLFWLMVLAPTGHAAIWHTPVYGSLTLAHVEHLVVAAISLLLITSFLARAHAGARFSRRVCIETSTLLTFLLATHFAIA